MDECLLYDLIECSVCLERLDGSSKVLPCQHTFCKPCLEEIVLSRKELRCPECRILVETKVDDLPCNILLIRILDGMKNAPRNQTPTLVPTPATTAMVHQSTPPKVEEQQQQQHKGNPWRPPYARALYAYDARESGDLQFKKGDVIVLRKKVDQNWFQGELGDKQGYVPASYVQVISGQPPPHVPQCRTLYDFKMNDSNEKDCLGFAKGEIVTVIRRIDENWAEGKLKDRIGIFPISFVEMNSPARSLMKLSTNLNPGPSRVAPPTPSSDSDTTPLITASCAHGARGAPQPTVACTSLSSSSSSSSSNSSASASSTTTSTSTSTSSSANSAPSTPSPGSPPRVRGRPSTGAVADASPPPWSPQYREKRHSLTAVPSPPLPLQGQTAVSVPGPVPVAPPQAAQHRRSLEILDGRGGATEQSANRCGQSPWRTEGSPTQTVQQTQTPLAISLYVALYAYKPQKDDELELRKGELYTVAEKCQDGWFKGASLVGRRAGVFPGNYVQLAKSQGGAPELPPRVLGNGAPAQATAAARSVSQSWDGSCAQDSLCQPPPPRLPCQPQGAATQVAAQPPPRGLTSAACEVTPPNVTVAPSQQHLWDKCSDKVWSSSSAHKDRKEKEGLGLMKRFASKKKCKSPPPSSAYSMDNPVFVDCAAVTVPSSHSRSESCPSEAAFDGGPAHKKTNSLDVDGDKESAKGQHAKYPAPLVRERFRCIVPYPPNSEYELELRVGDIIYVHKKREDGWFKGTLQRTGKTGLFPGSFVESF